MSNKDPFAQFNLPPARPEFGKQQPHTMARKSDIQTSKEAAKGVNTNKLEKIVYDCIRSFGASGCIGDEVVDRLVMCENGLPNSSVTSRYRPLIEKGFIIDTGERRYGKAGRKQRVMIADVFADQVEITPIEKKVKRCPHCGGEI